MSIRDVDALFDRARTAAAAGRLNEALDAVQAVLARAPDHVAAARLGAMLLTHAGADATAAWQRVADLVPHDAEARFQLGNAAGDRGDFASAVEHLEAAAAVMPDHPALLNNLGLAYEAAGRLDVAARSFRKLLAGVPQQGTVRESLARVLFKSASYAEALAELDALIRARPVPDPAWLATRAACLAETGRDPEASAAYRAAVLAAPQAADTWVDFARFLLARGRFDDAASVLAEAHAAVADDTLILSLLLSARQRSAEWQDVPALRASLIAQVRDPAWTGMAAAYDFTAICDDPSLQRRVAERYAAGESTGAATCNAGGTEDRSHRARPAGDAPRRLRLGFVSSDFREHPVARLVTPLLAHLDRSRFEVVAYATRGTADETAAAVAHAVDRYVALPRREPARAAAAIRADAVDVLLDLNGFSGDEALRIFARRPAPLQASFLGYTGTLGCAAYDLIVADRYCIPGHAAAHYVERALYVDPCYLPSDPARAVAAPPRRTDYDLPDDACVLYAQVALYKVSPELFARWLGVLREVSGAVLWLRHASQAVQARLRAAAVGAGVEGARLRFAPVEKVPRYLARMALSDLMLDTMPFGSHTTVNDALFMGVPVVTQAGASFAGRASASQVAAANSPDTIAPDAEDYGRLAVRLARDGARRAAAAEGLRAARATAPLFDLAGYAARFAEALVSARQS